MQQLPLPELGVSVLLFTVTLAISYAIIRILFGMRLPVSDKKTSTKKKSVDNTCPLNEIMGYDFIQIKTITPAEDAKATAGSGTTSQQTEEEKPFFYATANTKQEQIPEEPEPQEPVKIIDFTDDDMEVIANEPWEPGLNMEEQRRMADYYASQTDFACDNDEEEEMTEQEMQHEAEYEKYCDDYYEMMEKFATTSEDDAALMNLDKDLEESTGNDAEEDDDDNVADKSVPDEDDIPEI